MSGEYEKKKLRFDIKKAGNDLVKSKSFLGALGNSALFLAKGTFNVGMVILEELPNATKKAIENESKKRK